MKTFLLAFRFFKKRIVMNIILMMELTLILVISIVSLNTVAYSNRSKDVFLNSRSKILYCMDTSYMEGGYHDYKMFYDRLISIGRKFPGFQGVANLGTGQLALNRDKITDLSGNKNGQTADVLLLDDASIKALRFPLRSGIWLDVESSDGCVPCVIGGYGSEKYKIGDTMKGFFFIPEKKPSNKKPLIGEVDMRVTGKLAAQTGMLALGIYSGSSNTHIPASTLFEKTMENPLYIILPIRNYPLLWFRSWNNTLMYFSKDTLSSDIDKVRNELLKGSTRTDEELVSEENNQISQLIQLLLPFLVMLVLVSISGVFTVGLLTTLRSMDTFTVYYIVGATRMKTALITGVYLMMYFFGAVLFTVLALKFFEKSKFPRFVIEYFYLNASSNWPVVLTIMTACLGAGILPYLAIRKQNTIDMLKSRGE